MIATLKNEERKKAVLITCLIYVILLVLFFLIQWKYVAPVKPMATDVIFADLGNETNGFGENSPKIKGDPSSSTDNSNSDPVSSNNNIPNTDESDPDIAPSVTTNTPVDNSKNTTSPAIIMKKKTTNGNNADEDNGFSKGDDPNSKGGPGSKDGIEGGNGPSPTFQDTRSMKKHPVLEGGCGNAVIMAKIKVYPDGHGEFKGFGKGSASRDVCYQDEIIKQLDSKKLTWEKSDKVSQITCEITFKY